MASAENQGLKVHVPLFRGGEGLRRGEPTKRSAWNFAWSGTTDGANLLKMNLADYLNGMEDRLKRDFVHWIDRKIINQIYFLIVKNIC